MRSMSRCTGLLLLLRFLLGLLVPLAALVLAVLMYSAQVRLAYKALEGTKNLLGLANYEVLLQVLLVRSC